MLLQPDILEPTKYNYVVRFFNPDQRSKHVNKVWHEVHHRFKSVSTLKQLLTENFEDKLGGSNFECGYLERNGAKRCIETNQDLDAMYQGRNCDITLWCACESSNSRKRKAEESENAAPSKRVSKEEAVDKLTQELREKHGSEQFTGPQL